jgi:hypothetical protein
MAIEQSRRLQLACKIVDLRRLKFSPQTRIRRLGTAAAAKNVDSRVQMAKIKSWAQRKQKESRLEQQVTVCHREASILASLRHVSKYHGHVSSDVKLTYHTAKHRWH